MRLHTLALQYAAEKIPVFPCVPGGKRPLTQNGYLDCTTDSAKINRWWTIWPDANIAAPTGLIPGFRTADVLDIDVRGNNSGEQIYRELADNQRLAGATGIVRTPSGGLHIYFLPTEQRTSSLRGRYVDFKAQGGYALLPGSWVETPDYSGRYENINAPFLEDASKHQSFDWQYVVDNYPADEAEYQRQKIKSTADTWTDEQLADYYRRAAKEGNRNNLLFWCLNRALEAGINEPTELVRAALDSGLETEEVRTSVRSAKIRHDVHAHNEEFGRY